MSRNLQKQSTESNVCGTIGKMDGTKPVTDRNSKRVMLRSERSDRIRIKDIIQYANDEVNLFDVYEVKQRVSTYYGTELTIEPVSQKCDDKYLLTAPGPDSFLFIWESETDSDGFLTDWYVAAEVKAEFSENLPQYSICSKCGEPIKSLEHVRLAMTDNCPETNT